MNKILAFSFSFLLLSACGADSTTSDTFNLDVEILLEGDEYPATSNFGKSIKIIRNNDELINAWILLSNDEIPEINFSNNFVVLYSQGEINISECSKDLYFDSIYAKKNKSNIINLEFENRMNCMPENSVCSDVYIAAHPFKLIKISDDSSLDILFNESYIEETCN